MATEAEIRAQIAEIDVRLNAGTESVRHGDTSVAYNLGELRRRREELLAQLATAGTGRIIRHVRTYSGKGY